MSIFADVNFKDFTIFCKHFRNF